MNDIARLSGELNSDERELFSVATKNAVGTLRASWRMISSMQQKEESSGPQSRGSTARDYRYKIELELERFCQDVLDILDNLLIPNATSGEFEVFYCRMLVCLLRSLFRAVSYTFRLTFRINRKGDYHRYLAEIASGEKRSSATAAADEAYKVGACTSLIHMDSPLTIEFPECNRCCTGRAETHSLYPPGTGTQLLCIPIRNSEHPGPCVPPR